MEINFKPTDEFEHHGELIKFSDLNFYSYINIDLKKIADIDGNFWFRKVKTKSGNIYISDKLKIVKHKQKGYYTISNISYMIPSVGTIFIL